MIIRKKLIFAIALMLFGVTSNSFALDLRQYQGYLSGSRGKAAAQETKRSDVLPEVPFEGTTNNYRSLNADAYYVTSQEKQFIPLGETQSRKDGERFLIPQDTRVPKELRPLLTEQRTPRQGLALNGGTGATLVPSPGILEPNKTAIGVQVQTFELYNINDVKHTDEDYFDISISAAWGVEDGIEIGFDKTFSNQDHYNLEDPFYLNLKYQATGNVTLGGSINCEGGYSSAWVAAGVPVIWVGVGGNFGNSGYKHHFVNPQKFRRAKYGGYNYNYNTGKGYADEFFFLVGGLIPVNDNLRLVYDFNGDRFSLGFRFNYSNTLYLNASYISNGDYENLPGSIAHRRNKNFVVGGTVAF